MSKPESWLDIVCEWCGKEVRKKRAGRKPPRFCNRSCSAKWRMSQPEARARSAEVYRKIGRARRGCKHPVAAERMRRDNPMKSAATRKKVSTTLRAMGHKPSVQGGNGHGLTRPQALLKERTGLPAEVPVGVPAPLRAQEKCPILGKAPTNYKIDIADVPRKIAIEVDGPNHHALRVKLRDARKDRILSALGWTVLRFSNQEVLDDLETVVAAIQKAQSACTTSL